MRERETWPAMLMATTTGLLAYWLLASGFTDGRRWWLTRAVRDWQSVPCRIGEHWIESPVQLPDSPPKHHLRYVYVWNDRTFDGERYAFLDEPTTAAAWKDAIDKFPSERQTICLIDPQNPANSVLIAPAIPDSDGILEAVLRIVGGIPIAAIALCASVGVLSSIMARPLSGDGLPGSPLPSPRWSPMPRQRGKRLIAAESKPWFQRVGRWFGAVVRGNVRPPSCTVWCHTAIPRPGSTIAVNWDCRSHAGAEFVVRLVAREEVRPERALAHELHIHPLVTLPLGYEPSGQALRGQALRGQATVDLPIDQPPAWQGVRHQISWAIEAESQTPSGPCLWRFPLLIASPPRLHITPTSCPAELNLAAATSLTLVVPIADVMPGEAIAGTITWKLNHAPRFLELRLICRCHGVAGTEERIAASCRLERPATQGRSGFQLQHPGTPLSWQGALMACSWRIEAAADKLVFAAMDLTVIAAPISS